MKKKLFASRRWRPLTALLIIITAIIVHSCKKNSALAPDISTNDTGTQIKNWLTSNKTDTASAVAINGIIADADWQTARVLPADTLTYLAVKLKSPDEKFDDPTKAVDRYLVLVKNKGAVTDGYLYEIFGDTDEIARHADAYIANYNKSFDTDFNGNLTKLTLLNGLKETESYNSGRVAFRKAIVIKPHKNEVSVQSTQKTNEMTCSDFFLVTWWTDGDVNYQYLYRLCSCNGPSQSTAIRNRLGAMSVLLKPTCEGDGGGGGDYQAPPALDIVDSVLNPCLKKMVDSILSKNFKGKIDSMIINVFNAPQAPRLTITDQIAMVYPSDDGEDLPTYDSNPPFGLVSTSIRLNADSLANSSQEYIAATIMHEALHAYLDSKNIDIGDQQHAAMAAQYVDTMAADLILMFPNLTRDAAYSLAWGGLESTWLYQHPGLVYLPQYQVGINGAFRFHVVSGHTFGHGC